jgi:hypothetical protein
MGEVMNRNCATPPINRQNLWEIQQKKLISILFLSDVVTLDTTTSTWMIQIIEENLEKSREVTCFVLYQVLCLKFTSGPLCKYIAGCSHPR